MSAQSKETHMKHATQAILTLTIASLALGCGKLEKSATSKDVRDANNTASNDPEKPIDAGQISAPGSIAIDLQGAVALALTAPSAALNLADEPQSNLQRINADGTMSSAFSKFNPGAVVEKLYVQNNYTFLAFKKGINLLPDGVKIQSGYDKATKIQTCWDGAKVALGTLCTAIPTCVLVYADNSNGILKCVDYDIFSMYGANPIQFDKNGTLYYRAAGKNDIGGLLRKLDQGKMTPIATGEIGDFAISDAGDVAYRVGANSLHVSSSSGEVKKLPLAMGQPVTFPDGNIYVMRDAEGDLSKYNPAGLEKIPSPDGFFAETRTGFKVGEKYFALGCQKGCTKHALIQFYPTRQVFPLKNMVYPSGTMQKVGGGELVHIAQDGGLVVIPVMDGNKADGYVEKLLLYNLDTNTEKNILPSGISITAVAVDAKRNVVHFAGKADGLGLTDAVGEVTGSIDLNTMKTTTNPNKLGTVSDFKTLN